MRIRITLIISLLLFVVAGIFGISKKGSYTNMSLEEEPLESFYIAPFPDNLIDVIEPESFETTMFEEAENVMRVEAIGKSEFVFCMMLQRAVVKEVFYGDQSLVGQEIKIAGESGLLYFDSVKTYNSGYTRCMEAGKEYLVYVREEVNFYDQQERVFLCPAITVRTIFQYEDGISVPTGNSVYVPYSDVKDYEYYAQTQAGLDALLALKKYVINKWNP